MQYSLFFYILFLGFCGVFANNRHIRSLPEDHNIITDLAHSAIDDEKKVIFPENHPDCPIPPLECPNENITFWYYSRVVGDHPIPLRYVKSRTTGPNKGPGPWKALIHGFAQTKEEFPVKDMIKAYNEKGDYNIFVVEYMELAKEDCFWESIRNIHLIAKCTAEMLDYLITTEVFKAEDMHVIGFGLGAHIASSLQEHLTGGKIGRVTELDPFTISSLPISDKSCDDSGNFVDVYHTNGLLRESMKKTGHIEFFFNSGMVQPGCYKDEKDLLPCSHDRVASYYIESITHEGNSEEGFFGIPCPNFWYFAAKLCNGTDDNYVKAGEDVDIHKHGTYHLQTKNHHPFALGKHSVYDPELQN